MTSLVITAVALASLAFGPERALTAPSTGPAAGSQSQAQIATSGNEILVTWRDDAPGRSGLYVAAVTEDGVQIEGTQRRLSEDDTALPPRIVWTGSAYLIVWSPHNEIKAMTIDGERRVVMPERTILRDAFATSNIVRIGNRCALLAGRDLVVLDLAGNVVHTGPDMDPKGPVLGGHLATDGHSFFVFWNAWDDANVGKIYVRRFMTNGDARDAAPVAVTPTLQAIREDWGVAFGDGAFAVVAAEHLNNGDGNPRTLRPFLVQASTLATTTLPSLFLGIASGTSVEWIGDRWVALWFQFDDANVARMHTMEISPAGTLGTPVARCQARGFEAAELWTGRKLMTAFTTPEPRSFETDVDAGVAEPAGTTPCSAIAFSPSWQSWPALATNGVQSLVVWTEGLDSGAVRVIAARATKGVLDRAPIVLTENGAPGARSVVYTGSVYVVVWLELTDFTVLPIVQMQRISVDAVLLDREPIALDYGLSPSLTSNGTQALLAWSNTLGVRAARLTRDGAFLDAEPLEIPAPDVLSGVVAASNGDEFFVVWEKGSHGEFPSPGLIDLYGARIDPGGLLLGPLIALATGPMDQYGAAVASDGRDYLVAYVEDDHLVTKKVLREGSLSASTAQDEGSVVDAGVSTSVSVTWLGNGYAIAWEAEDPNGFAVRLASLDGDGTVREAPTTLALSPLGGTRPALATNAGRGDLLYALLTEDALLGGAMRLFTRRLGAEIKRTRAVRH
jgi:hypothetical protein